MPTPIEESATEVMGPGFSGFKIFNPVAFEEGMLIQDRYRSTMGAIARERAAQDALSGIAQDRYNRLKAIRGQEAMSREGDVLAELDKLDPLSGTFETDAAQFNQMASLSPAVASGLKMKMGIRGQFNEALGVLAQSGVAAGLDDEQLAATQSTAQELLRQGKLGSFRLLLSRNQRMGRDFKLKHDMHSLEAELLLRDRYDVKKQERSFQNSFRLKQADNLVSNTDKAVELFRNNRQEQRDLFTDLPEDVLTDEEYHPWFNDPFDMSEDLQREFVFNMDVADAEGEDEMRKRMKELGATKEEIDLVFEENGEVRLADPLRIEEKIANQIVQSKMLTLLQDYGTREGKKLDEAGVPYTGKELMFSGFDPYIANKLKDADEAAKVDKVIDKLAADALTMTQKDFVATYATASKDALQEAFSEAGEGNPAIEMLARPSTRAQRFLEGLHKSVTAVRELAQKKRMLNESLDSYEKAVILKRFQEQEQFQELVRKGREEKGKSKTSSSGDWDADWLK